MPDIAERTVSSLHENDEHAWITQQVKALRSGDYAALDRDNLVEFLTSMALRDERELELRLIILLSHQINMQCQPERISRSWKLTISKQQRAIRRLLRKLPSLAARADDVFIGIVPDAIAQALEETGLPSLNQDVSGLSLNGAMSFNPWSENDIGT